MFDHVTIRARDRDATERLYRAVLGAVGREPTYVGPDLVEWDDLSIAQATPARPATAAPMRPTTG